MPTYRVQAKADGRVVGWSELQEGRLIDVRRLTRLFLTTTLTDVISDLCGLCGSLDPGYRIRMIVPNGPTTTALDLLLVGREFEIVCARRLVRGWFPFNPLAPEFGANYDVVVTTHASPEVDTRIAAMLESKYDCTGIA